MDKFREAVGTIVDEFMGDDEQDLGGALASVCESAGMGLVDFNRRLTEGETVGDWVESIYEAGR